MEGEPRKKEDRSENCDIPNAKAASRKHPEGSRGGRPNPSASSEASPADLQGSDCLPSIVLAVLLILLFLLVSFLLLHQNQGRFPLEDCRSLGPQKHCPWTGGLQSLALLFPNQMDTTWKILQEYMYGQLEGANPAVLVAVGLGDARGTLLCLAKAIVALLTGQQAVKIRFLEERSPPLPWVPFPGNRTSITTRAAVFAGQSPIPYGLILSAQVSWHGEQQGTKADLAVMVNGMEQAREKVLQEASSAAVISDALEVLHAPQRVPGWLLKADRRFVLLLRSEHHLEGDFVC